MPNKNFLFNHGRDMIDCAATTKDPHLPLLTLQPPRQKETKETGATTTFGQRQHSLHQPPVIRQRTVNTTTTIKPTTTITTIITTTITVTSGPYRCQHTCCRHPLLSPRNPTTPLTPTPLLSFYIIKNPWLYINPWMKIFWMKQTLTTLKTLYLWLKSPKHNMEAQR